MAGMGQIINYMFKGVMMALIAWLILGPVLDAIAFSAAPSCDPAPGLVMSNGDPAHDATATLQTLHANAPIAAVAIFIATVLGCIMLGLRDDSQVRYRRR